MAARDLKVALSIDGAKQVAAAFAEVGNAAKSASSTISGAFNKAAVDNKLFVSLNKLKSGFNDFGGYLKNVGGALSNVEQNFIRFTSRVGILTASLTGLGVAAGAFVNRSIQTSSELVDNANSVGLAASKYAELEFILGQTGVSSEKFRNIFVKINDTIPLLADDTSKLGQKLIALGVTSQDPTKFFFQLLDATKKLGSEQQRIAFLSEVLGPKIGPRLAEAAAIGSKGIRELGDSLRARGLFPTTQELKTLENTGDSISAFGRTLEYVRIKLVALAGPTITKIFESLTNAVINNKDKLLNWADQKIQEAAEWVQAAIDVFSGGAYVENGKTEQIKNLRTQFLGFASDIYNAYLTIKDTFVKITDSINSTFGTNFSPTFVAALLVLGRVTGAFTLLFSVISLGASIFAPIISAIAATTVSLFGLQTALLGIASLLGGAAIGAALIYLVYLIYQNFDAIKAYIAQFVSNVGILFSDLGSYLTSKWSEFTTYVQSLWDAAVLYLQTKWAEFSLYIQTKWEEAILYLQTKWEEFKVWLGESVASLKEAFFNLGTTISKLWTDYVTGPISRGIQYLQNALSNFATTVSNALTNAFQAASNRISGIVETIIGYVRRALSFVQNLVQSAINAAARLAGLGGGGGTRYASGGYVSGAGTATSDSIPAWLSNGEFVMRAAAVRKYGLSLFQRLNGLNLSDSIRQGFAMGGLVGLPAPALAPIAGGRPINLTIGNDVFAMNAPDDVAERLIKYASKRNIASTGRKPGWYGS